LLVDLGKRRRSDLLYLALVLGVPVEVDVLACDRIHTGVHLDLERVAALANRAALAG
jgi:hypothetical protein